MNQSVGCKNTITILWKHMHYKWNYVGHNWGKKISCSNPNNPKFKYVIVL